MAIIKFQSWRAEGHNDPCDHQSRSTSMERAADYMSVTRCALCRSLSRI